MTKEKVRFSCEFLSCREYRMKTEVKLHLMNGTHSVPKQKNQTRSVTMNRLHDFLYNFISGIYLRSG
jgi:hypothetical protein